MATEEGIVLKAWQSPAPKALVKTTRSSACESCSHGDSCSAAENKNEMEVLAVNTAHAEAGDRILLNIKTGPLLKATFLLYVFPILCMIAGAVIGQKIAISKGWDPSGLSALIAFAAFGIAFVVIKIRGAGMSKKSEYKPEIIRILRKQEEVI